MHITCMSDSHYCHAAFEVPKGDIFIHAGDALARGTKEELIHFNEWLGRLPHKHKIYVPGNHDEIVESNIEKSLRTLTNATVLIDQYIEIEGLKIYGSPWTPTFYDWNFMKSDAELESVWEKIPENLDILITHGPPYGILDQNRRGDHCGSQSLYRAVIQKNPKLHIFGHIHESAGELRHYNTHFINAAVLDGWYQFGRQPIDIEI